MDFTESRALAQHQRARILLKQNAIQASVEAVADAALKVCIRYTSGRIPQSDFTQAGHPFARQHPPTGHNPRVGLSGAFVLVPINVQSGRLLAGWKKSKRRAGKGETIWTVFNDSPEARFALSPEGTKFVIARGFRPAVNEQVRQFAPQTTLRIWREADI